MAHDTSRWIHLPQRCENILQGYNLLLRSCITVLYLGRVFHSAALVTHPDTSRIKAFYMASHLGDRASIEYMTIPLNIKVISRPSPKSPPLVVRLQHLHSVVLRGQRVAAMHHEIINLAR